MEPDNTEANEKRRAIAKASKAELLEPFYDIGLLDTYAKAYGKLPREIAQEPFDEVIPYFVLWQKQSDYYERYQERKKFIDGNTKE